MKKNKQMMLRLGALMIIVLTLSVASLKIKADTGLCGGLTTILPFTDVSASPFFCQIAEAYFSGLTNGTTPTTYSPNANVSREQMAAFITRTLDQSLKRGSKRAALRQFWTPQSLDSLGITTVGNNPISVKSDGADIWVSNSGDGTVSRVRASDGKLLATWTGATNARAVLVALGKVYVTGTTSPGKLYEIDPTQPPGVVTTIASSLGSNPASLACDGSRIWIADQVLEIVSFNPTLVSTVSAGLSNVSGVIYDGTNMWVTDLDNTLKQLNSSGNVVITTPLGSGALPDKPAFDGANIWVPNNGNSTLTVVRATGSMAGTVLTTLTGNGLSRPKQAAFDGERILVIDFDGLSLWNASSLAPLGAFFTGTSIFPSSVCSDGLSFWVSLARGGQRKLARF